jgi:hypothetical protein
MAVHAQPVVTVKFTPPAEDDTTWFAGVTASVQDACVRLTVTGVYPIIVTVIVAVLVLPVVFAV